MRIQPFQSPRGCLSYVVYSPHYKEALLVDPSSEMGEVYKKYLGANNLKLRFIVETHTHADHISSSGELKRATGALLLTHERAPTSHKDKPLGDGDRLSLGDVELTILYTPGHTEDSLSLLGKGFIFTGDALLIEGTGRTDFQNGSSGALFESLWQKILPLGDDVIVYPAHDYKNRSQSTLGEIKKINPRLRLSKEKFIQLMDSYHPPKPELFEMAIRENTA